MAEREGREAATHIFKKRCYSKTIKGKSLDEGEDRGLPSHCNKKKGGGCCQVLARVLLLV